ncbi:MAG TPA: hypothetical protein VLJ61_09400 [Pyrinomonadaceae bacterium]|nr:hypothetical protein [Pyrinomonadaceae bacterium]
MFDRILNVIFLFAGNAAFWLLILSRRARRFVIKGWIRRYGTNDAGEEIKTGELVILCMAVVGEMAFILLTVAVIFGFLRR